MKKIGKITMVAFMFALLAGPVFSLALVSNTQALVSEVHAAVSTPTMPSAASVGSMGKTLEATIKEITKWIVGFLILISIFFMVYGGILYITAGGDESKVEAAKKLLTGALLGLVIALLAWAIINVLVVTIFGYGAGTA